MIRNCFILLEIYKAECEYHCWMSKKKAGCFMCNLKPIWDLKIVC